MPKNRNSLSKLWKFIWKEDSALSWIVNIVLAVVIIKFVLYPVMGLALGTSFPIVAVVSNSMVHQEPTFDQWWNENKPFYIEKGITKEEFQEFTFRDGFIKGDVMVLVGVNKETIKVGDVVVVKTGTGTPVIHRVVALHENSFETKGEASSTNKNQIQQPGFLDETNIPYENLLGKAVGRVPLLGYIKIGFSEFMKLFGVRIA